MKSNFPVPSSSLHSVKIPEMTGNAYGIETAQFIRHLLNTLVIFITIRTLKLLATGQRKPVSEKEEFCPDFWFCALIQNTPLHGA